MMNLIQSFFAPVASLAHALFSPSPPDLRNTAILIPTGTIKPRVGAIATGTVRIGGDFFTLLSYPKRIRVSRRRDRMVDTWDITPEIAQRYQVSFDLPGIKSMITRYPGHFC